MLKVQKPALQAFVFLKKWSDLLNIFTYKYSEFLLFNFLL